MAIDEIMGELAPRKRAALDGRVWWVVWDSRKSQYSTLLCFGRYRTKKACQAAINYYSSTPETRRFLFA